MKKYTKVISQLKTNAEQRNWDSFLQALNSVVCEMDKETIVELLLSYVHVFMSQFLEINTQYKSEHDKLFADNYRKLQSDYLAGVIQILDGYRGKPGVNNSIKGISKLQKLLEFDYCKKDFIEAFLNSVTNLLIAISQHSWGVHYPTVYLRWLHGTSNEDILILATNPELARKSKEIMLQFSNDIDLILHSDTE